MPHPRRRIPGGPAAPQDAERHRFARSFATRLCILLVLLSGATAQAQKAQKGHKAQKGKVLFQPELFVGAGYTDNALLVETAESNESLIYRMGAHLPFTRTYPGGASHSATRRRMSSSRTSRSWTM